MSDTDDLREIALSLPETSERAAWGMPTFRVKDKIFASINPRHGVGVKISREERAELVAAEPEKFFWTSHDENYDMMRLHLEAIGVDELRELLTDAWCATAPKPIRTKYDGII
ncbi:MAG: MmcQ/YjbR family DNA-binding protein [Sciscionella sp.]